MFPCKICSGHFQNLLLSNPVKNSNREELVLYMCNIHNIVNKRLNKTEFDCNETFHFWGGDCGCDGSHNVTLENKIEDKNSTISVNATNSTEVRNKTDEIKTK
jgi:FAD-linked sulfhydryl oxidase